MDETKSTAEDDTFRRLKRTPFSNLDNANAPHITKYGWTTLEWHNYLKANGWEYTEWLTEYRETNK